MASTPAGGIWAPERRALSIGLVLTITLVASEALAVVTILPLVRQDLGGLRLYGWVTSAFFLGSLFGIVLAGQEADRRGPARPFVVGLTLFAIGLAVGGSAPSMGVLVLGRAIQGVGGGAIPAVAYVSIGRSYPESLQPRIFAVMSTAWVLPGLAGPGLSALVAEHVGWRWVFFGLIPLVAAAGSLAVRSLRRLAPLGGTWVPGRTLDALRVAAGTGLVLAGLTSASPLLAVVFIAGGVVVGVKSLRRLLPAGTFSARPGLPVAVLSRGLLTFAFFGTDAFVPLTVTSVRGRTTAVASIVVTTATMTWTAGAWVQERTARLWSGRRLVTAGMLFVVAGIGCVGSALSSRTPLALIGIGWGIGGFGIGLAYAPISVMVLGQAPPGQEGAASASMQLADNLGVALGAGVGGAAIALGQAVGWPLRTGLAIAFAAAAVVGLIGVAIAYRLPRGALAATPGERAAR
jgi:MFS family permease